MSERFLDSPLYSFANSIDPKGIGALGGGQQPSQPSETPATQHSDPTTYTYCHSKPTKTSEEKKSPGFELIAAILGISMAFVLRKRK